MPARSPRSGSPVQCPRRPDAPAPAQISSHQRVAVLQRCILQRCMLHALCCSAAAVRAAWCMLQRQILCEQMHQLVRTYRSAPHRTGACYSHPCADVCGACCMLRATCHANAATPRTMAQHARASRLKSRSLYLAGAHVAGNASSTDASSCASCAQPACAQPTLHCTALHGKARHCMPQPHTVCSGTQSVEQQRAPVELRRSAAP